MLIEEYANYLHEVRGLTLRTVSHHRYTAQCFLQHLDEERITLKDIQPRHLESYVIKASRRLSRVTLHRDISALRGFLRFLAIDGRVPDRTGQPDRCAARLPWRAVTTHHPVGDGSRPFAFHGQNLGDGAA